MSLRLFLPGTADRQRRRILAWACVRLTGRVGKRSEDYLRSFGEDASWQSVDAEARAAVWRSRAKLTPGPSSGQMRRAAATDEAWVLRQWLLVRWEALGIFRAVVEIPGDARTPTPLLPTLRHVLGVCEIYERHHGGVLATIAYESPTELERIRSAIEELAGAREIIVSPIRAETHLPLIATLEQLATPPQVPADG